MSNPWDSVLPSVATAVVTTVVLWAGSKAFRSAWDKRRYAFTLELGMGPVWYLRKLGRKPATNVSYHAMQRDLSPRDVTLAHTTIEPGTSYGIWNLEEGDTFEIYWTEGSKSYSTFRMIHEGERSIKLRRENTGH